MTKSNVILTPSLRCISQPLPLPPTLYLYHLYTDTVAQETPYLTAVAPAIPSCYMYNDVLDLRDALDIRDIIAHRI